MANYCLPQFAADTFLEKLKGGEIDPQKLTEMTSEERRDFFKDIVGEENAKGVNALFESKLLLKNQQQGMINWAKQLTGITPEVRRDLITRVEKMKDILQPKELDKFLADLAERRLGVGVTVEEADKIAELSKKVKDTKAIKEAGGDRLAYGKAVVEFHNYVNDLKTEAGKTTFKEKAKEAVAHPLAATIELGGQAKSVQASLDNSAIFRQGWKTMFTNPGIWFKNTVKSLADIGTSLKGHEALDAVKADIISRENYDLMKQGGLAVGTREEAYPGSFLEKIPGLGRLYKASEQAYTGFVHRMRADIFDKYVEIAKQAGVETDKEWAEGNAKVVNSLTGRGSLGAKGERAAEFINNIFFSPRFVKSHIDNYFLHPLGTEVGRGSFAQKMAVKNLAKIVVGQALVIGVARALSDKNGVELDPRSSNFGKLKIGDTYFDISGGAGALATLAARLGTWTTKSSSTGDVTAVNSGTYGGQTGLDVLVNFMAGKASPLGAVLIDYLKQQDRNGGKFSPLKEAGSLFTPLPIKNAYELLQDPNSANDLVAILADGLGIATNTYAPSANGVIAQDKPNVLQESLDKLSKGDKEGAQALVDDFNKKLRDSIEKDISTKDPTISPEDLQTKTDTKFKKNKLEMPSEKQATDYEVGGKDVVDKILANGKPVVKQNTELPSTGIIGTVMTYAHALGVDPQTAFNRIFTGQRITAVRNGTVIVERMSLKDSTAVKENRGGNNSTMKLDHTLPLELGGSNSEDNLKLVPTSVWKSYSPVEDYLGTALKDGKVDKKTAQDLIQKFKNKEVTFSEIKSQIKS